jgi:predicted Zn-dependent protease
MIDISAEQEAAIGMANFRMVLTQYHGRVLPTNSPTARYVERVGRRIAASAEQISPPGVHYQWEFVVIDSPEPNAFCLPGGKVAVFTGILPILVDENSVAAVLSHEIAHAVARHGAEKLAFAKILLLLQIVINQFIDTRLLTNMLMQLLLTLPFSRKMESEADYIGLHLMAAACFDPQAMAPMFERMKALRQKLMQGKKAPPSYLSTHPADEDRVAAIIRWLPEVMPAYESKCIPAAGEWKRALRAFSLF